MDNTLIDLKDRRILAALDFRARMPLADLAKITGLSKQSLDYRIKSLVKRGIIEGFFPVINSPKLGYIYCRSFVQFKSISPEQEMELRKDIFKNKKLFWAFSLGGTFDYLLVYWVRNLREFEEINIGFQEKFGGIIRNKEDNAITNVIHLSHKCFLEKNKIERFDLEESDERLEIDQNDKKIIKVLASDARLPLVQMSEKTGISPKVIAYRIKKMEENGVIAAYRPIINYTKLGLTYFKVFFNFDLSKRKKFDEFQKYLINHPKVIFLVHGIGMLGNLDVELLAESNQDFFGFIQEAKRRFPEFITDYQYLIYTQTIKVNYAPF